MSAVLELRSVLFVVNVVRVVDVVADVVVERGVGEIV